MSFFVKISKATKNIGPIGPIFLPMQLSFCWSFGCFLCWSFFFWLVFAKLVCMLCSYMLLWGNLNPFWHLDAFLSKDADNTRTWLSAIAEVFFNFFFVQNSSFGMWVVAADLSDDTTRKRVTLRFLDDYPIKR